MKYEITPIERKLANLGRFIMDQAITEKDDDVSSNLSQFGHALCGFNTEYGIKARDLTAEHLALINKYSKLMSKKLNTV